MSLPLAQAADLNNEGATALFRLDIRTAINLLAKSMQFMQGAKILQSSSEISKSSFQMHACRVGHLFFREISDTAASDTPIFNQVIFIPKTEVGITSSIGAVIFNLALAYQILGCKVDASFTAKAITFYEMVLKVLEREIEEVGQSSIVIWLACINNLSQIRISNGDYKHNEGMNQLSNNLLRTASSADLEKPVVKRLLMSALMMFQAPQIAPAA